MTTLKGKRAIAFATIALFGTVGTGVALAQAARAAWRGDRIERAYQRILGRLDLSPDQKSQIDALVAAEKPNLQELVQQLKSDATTLRAAARSAQPDPSAVGAAFLKVRADGQALRTELQRVRQGTEAVLTPAQKGEFEAYLTTLRGMHRRFRPANG